VPKPRQLYTVCAVSLFHFANSPESTSILADAHSFRLSPVFNGALSTFDTLNHGPAYDWYFEGSCGAPNEYPHG